MQNIIKKKILPSLPGNYQIVDNYILKLPIKDIVIGFFIERSSKEDFYYVWWFSLPLYIPNDMLHLTFGDRIKLENDSQLWDFRDSKIENTLSHLLAKLQVQKKALEFLEIPKNFYDYYFSKRENNIYIYEAVICSGYWIDIPQINTQLENCLTYINNELDQNIAWIKKIYDDLTLLRSRSNSNQVLEMLRTWRENSLFKLNLFDHLN